MAIACRVQVHVQQPSESCPFRKCADLDDWKPTVLARLLSQLNGEEATQLAGRYPVEKDFTNQVAVIVHQIVQVFYDSLRYVVLQVIAQSRIASLSAIIESAGPG